jgi:hypothetical protein
MHCPAQYWLIQINVAISDFHVEATFGIGTNPDFIVDRCPLAAEIRQRHQVTSATFLAFRENEVLHRATSHLIMTLTVYNNRRLLATQCAQPLCNATEERQL